jgi:hypothetical protein
LTSYYIYVIMNYGGIKKEVIKSWSVAQLERDASKLKTSNGLTLHPDSAV